MMFINEQVHFGTMTIVFPEFAEAARLVRTACAPAALSIVEIRPPTAFFERSRDAAPNLAKLVLIDMVRDARYDPIGAVLSKPPNQLCLREG